MNNLFFVSENVENRQHFKWVECFGRLHPAANATAHFSSHPLKIFHTQTKKHSLRRKIFVMYSHYSNGNTSHAPNTYGCCILWEYSYKNRSSISFYRKSTVCPLQSCIFVFFCGILWSFIPNIKWTNKTKKIILINCEKI